jgi:hypothetical protein
MAYYRSKKISTVTQMGDLVNEMLVFMKRSEVEVCEEKWSILYVYEEKLNKMHLQCEEKLTKIEKELQIKWWTHFIKLGVAIFTILFTFTAYR